MPVNDITIARWNKISESLSDAVDSPPHSCHPNADEDDLSASPSTSYSSSLTGLHSASLQHEDYQAHEIVTIDTKIKPSNKGFALLQKMGWSEGQPLGLSQDARVDPIPFKLKQDSTGIGKMAQDTLIADTTVAQRRQLASERQRQETEAQRAERQAVTSRQADIQEEVLATLRAFYCVVCDKQFKNVAQFDEHTNSYAHAHKARQHSSAPTPWKADSEKRKEKDRKREEKELRRIAAANGIRLPKPKVPNVAHPPPPPSVLPPDTPSEMFPKAKWKPATTASDHSARSAEITADSLPVAEGTSTPSLNSPFKLASSSAAATPQATNSWQAFKAKRC